MDLLKAIAKVEQKDRERNQLLGKNSMLIDSLRELGYSNLEEAEDASDKLSKEVTKMTKNYNEGKDKFKLKFAHLLT